MGGKRDTLKSGRRKFSALSALDTLLDVWHLPSPGGFQMLRYMVVEKKTKTFLKGAITAQQLEDRINEHAEKAPRLDHRRVRRRVSWE